MYVLLTKKENYFVEYYFNSLIISDSKELAMKFENYGTAEKFKAMLFSSFKLTTIIGPI